jgi:3-oxoacyl-[acyl-carrier protein] reductase
MVDSGELAGRVALVTGGSKGIGKSIAGSLARAGANVVIVARTGAILQSAAEELAGLVGEVTSVAADATDPSAAQHAVESAVQRFGRLDILVNNAGGVNRVAAFSDLTRNDWFKVFELNLMSVVYFVQSALPWLKQSGNGRIINISSISGVEPGLLVPHYCAAKAAVINLSKHLANLFAGDGILVNAVCPGQVSSDARNDLAEYVAQKEGIALSAAAAQIDAKGAAAIPLGRIGEPDDVAGLVTFLASNRAGWITGTCLHVNGGKHRSAF